MKVYIKNMVCSRCKMVVKNCFIDIGITPIEVELGEITIDETPTREQLALLNSSLEEYGFELIDNKRSVLIEKIKNIIVEQVHYSTDGSTTKLSVVLAEKLHQDYGYLSNLFSEVEGTTIEQYMILQKVEKAKELLVYDELTISEIAFKLGYSSQAYLSSQFKKITGLTPSHFKQLKEKKRTQLEDL